MAARISLDGSGETGLPPHLTAAAVVGRMRSYRRRGAWFICRIDRQMAGFAALEPVPDEKKVILDRNKPNTAGVTSLTDG